MLEQALELRVEVRIVGDAFQVVKLGHPLDLKNDESNRQRMFRKDRLCDRFRRADHFTGTLEGCKEVLAKAFEQVDMLGLFAREVQKGSNARIAASKQRTRMIQNEREDELLDQPERIQVVVAANLVENHSLPWGEEIQPLDTGQ